MSRTNQYLRYMMSNLEVGRPSGNSDQESNYKAWQSGSALLPQFLVALRSQLLTATFDNCLLLSCLQELRYIKEYRTPIMWVCNEPGCVRHNLLSWMLRFPEASRNSLWQVHDCPPCTSNVSSYRSWAGSEPYSSCNCWLQVACCPWSPAAPVCHLPRALLRALL